MSSERPILNWSHLIDSRPSTGVEDQGAFETLADGNVTETGRMFNPATDRIEPYVETWRRLPIGPGARYCVLELLCDKDLGVVGYLGRVGHHDLGCGTLSTGEYIAWRDCQGRRVYQFGDNVDAVLPSLPEVLPDHWQVGVVCRLGQQDFVVRHLGTCGT